MKLEAIHIVSLDVPFPPDYGGMFDIYYKCQGFKALGIRVILHCFEYGRGTQHALTEVADEVHYYPRKLSVSALMSKLPFIVATRRSEALLQRLLQDKHPILLEGDHCAGLLLEERLKDRYTILRVHNIEWKYYRALAKATPSLLKKVFFRLESKKLRAFEKTLLKADILFCVSQTELKYYQQRHPAAHLWIVNCIFESPEQLPAPGNFALFQGNLSVAENEKAVLWILRQWKEQHIRLPLIVAGRNPSPALKAALDAHPQVQTIVNPETSVMNELIQTAAVNLLITFQATGVKLKLINALFQGNRCIVNPEMVEGTSFAPYCEIVRDGKELAAALENSTSMQHVPDRERRLKFLKQHFDLPGNMQIAIRQIEAQGTAKEQQKTEK